MVLQISITPSCSRILKKIHAREKKIVDKVVNDIATDPYIGEEKKGDLSGVFVYKFKLNKQETLLAYRLQPNRLKPKELVILSLGSHENFYAELKR
jgi:mRNA-degrading endonuclease RelE of RelBE toxin-antitoxin system